ncbi:hypothetical protein AVEN_65454-1 [Araneus ventricosus]|uniref:Uncharacterized protein n=1 Tax=Araneus ventricosus TaxID=182803 RepID=A0A4Y2IIN9_ARAVE|nr:hypothetical protein AVEN_65454-1 [Araneus ventricosus]
MGNETADSPARGAVSEGISTPAPLPLCYTRNILLRDILYHCLPEWSFSRIPPLNIISGPDLRLCSVLSMDLLQLICTDFICDPQIHAVVEKWALHFNSQRHVRSPLLGIFLLLAVPIYYFGKKKKGILKNAHSRAKLNNLIKFLLEYDSLLNGSPDS